MPSDQLEEERDEFSDEKELTGGVVVVYGSSLFNEVYRLGLQILIFIYHGFPLLMNGGGGGSERKEEKWCDSWLVGSQIQHQASQTSGG